MSSDVERTVRGLRRALAASGDEKEESGGAERR